MDERALEVMVIRLKRWQQLDPTINANAGNGVFEIVEQFW
jgi:hypothetical protein